MVLLWNTADCNGSARRHHSSPEEDEQPEQRVEVPDAISESGRNSDHDTDDAKERAKFDGLDHIIPLVTSQLVSDFAAEDHPQHWRSDGGHDVQNHGMHAGELEDLEEIISGPELDAIHNKEQHAQGERHVHENLILPQDF